MDRGIRAALSGRDIKRTSSGPPQPAKAAAGQP